MVTYYEYTGRLDMAPATGRGGRAVRRDQLGLPRLEERKGSLAAALSASCRLTHNHTDLLTSTTQYRRQTAAKGDFKAGLSDVNVAQSTERSRRRAMTACNQ